MGKSNKRYILGRPMKVADADRLLGQPKKKEFSWQEIKDQAARKKLSIKQQI